MAKVLIVDDEEVNSLMLTKLLQRFGHETRVAATPTEAIRVAVAFEPEIVFTDILLPEIDGYELARILKERCTFKPRVIAVTGYTQEETEKSAHLDGYLVKPVSFEHILLALKPAAQPS